MWRMILAALGVAVLAGGLYLAAWPVPIEPVAWEAPANPVYSGPFAVNRRLAGVELLAIGDNTGPEDIALDAQGRICAATHQGRIVRLAADGSGAENWAETGGRPLGLDFDGAGDLIVADAYRGLLSLAPDGTVTVLATEADGRPILFADDVDVARDGRIYFSDASTKFGAEARGGAYEASLLDLMEHGGHGRLLVHDPASGETRASPVLTRSMRPVLRGPSEEACALMLRTKGHECRKRDPSTGRGS